MAKYTLTWHGTIIDNEDGWNIPQDSGNRHFQEYQQWKREGNWPDFELDAYALDKENSRYLSTYFSEMKYNIKDFPTEVKIP